MHEQSETVQRPDGKWVNVYGKALPKAGQQLPDSGEFNTMDEAVKDAKARSADAGWESAPTKDDGWESAPAKPVVEEPRTVFGDLGKNVPVIGGQPTTVQDVLRKDIPLFPGAGSTATLQDAVGLLEQPGAGLYGLLNEAQAGTRGLFKAGIAKMTGLNFGEVFSEEYNAAKGDMPEYVPLTPSGAKMQEKLGHVLEAGLKAYGNAAFELGRPLTGPSDVVELATRRATGTTLASPAAGATAEAMATLFSLIAPIPGMKGGKPLLDPISSFEKSYPRSAAALDASQIGKIKVDAYQPVMDAVTQALDKELGGDPQVGVSPGEKLKMVIQKLAPDMPPADQIAVSNAYVTRFKDLADRQQAAADARPKLSAPPEPPAKGTPAYARQQKDFYATQRKAYEDWVAESESTLSGKPTGIKSKQSGSIEIDGLEFNVPAGIKTLEEATAKGVVANYFLTRNEKNFFKAIDYQTWEDFTNHVPSAKFEGGMVNLATHDIPRFKEILDYINSPYNTSPVGGIPKVNKQRGSIEIQGVEENLPKAEQVVKQATGKAWTVSDPQQAAATADRALEASYKTMADRAKIFTMETVKAVRRAIVSHDFDLQGDLKRAGPAGEDAMLKINVEHNAMMMAKQRYDAAGSKIFDDLAPEQNKALEKVIRLRRIVEIDKNKGVGKVTHEIDPVSKKPITGPMASALLDQLEKATPMFKDIDAKATAVFTEERINLHRLLEEGMIDDKTFLKALELDYTMPEYLNVIDPRTPIKSAGLEREGPSSGIPYRTKPVNQLDARGNLQDNIARVENRIARNKTLLALSKLAEESPENGIVQKGETLEKGWTRFQYMEDGKKQHLKMLDSYADQFGARNDILQYGIPIGDNIVTVAGMIRTLSGSSLLRGSTTTYNPSFILAGLPMDILHLWLATNKTYSTVLPKYLGQISRDLAVTAHDAFFRTGRWDQAMLEGMGPNFLTHESRAGAINPKILEPKLQRLRKAAAFMGDFQDMWVRLAHRERLIRDGVDAQTATAMAVERLNYYRGGAMTKFVDTFIPYTNIAVNSLSKVVEAGAADKKAMFAKLGQLTSVLAAAKLANMMMSPETDKAISTEDKVRNVQMTFGDQYFVTDPDGNKRYLYANIRLDQTAMPFNAALVAGLESAEYGRVPDGILTKAIGQVNPLSTMFPPAWQAYRSYTDNYDPLRDSQIYHGLKVKPEDEIRNISRGQPTNALAQFAGDTLGMSPMGLEKAAGSLVNSNNFFLQIGGGLKMLFTGMDPRERAQSTAQMFIERFPAVRAVVKLTTPGLAMMKDVEKITMEANSKYKKQIDGLEEVLFRVEQKQASMREVESYISAQPPEAQKTLADHAKYEYSVDKILKEGKASEGIPPRNWWLATARIRDEARGQVFYNEWISLGSEDRRRMLGVANQLQQAGTGYMSQSFHREFQKNLQLLGTEQR